MSRSIFHVAALLVASATLSAAGGQATPGRPASPPPTEATRARPRASTATSLTGTHVGASSTIQGNALTSTNGQMANALVRLRDARFGGIVDTQITDRSGMFAFRGIDPGSYIVEVMGSDQTVLAASELLNVNAGDAVSAIVKLPFRMPPFTGVMGANSTPTVVLLATQAAANGVMAIVATTPVSPVR